MTDPKKPITQPSMAASKPTVTLPQMTDRAMLEDLYRITKGTAESVRTLTDYTRTIRGELDLLIGDVGSLQQWKIDTEERTRKHSGGIARISTSDETQNTVLSNLLVKVAETDDRVAKLATTTAAIEIKTDAQTRTLGTISDAVSGFAREHPIVVTSICTLIVSACTYVTQWLAAKGH